MTLCLNSVSCDNDPSAGGLQVQQWVSHEVGCQWVAGTTCQAAYVFIWPCYMPEFWVDRFCGNIKLTQSHLLNPNTHNLPKSSSGWSVCPKLCSWRKCSPSRLRHNRLASTSPKDHHTLLGSCVAISSDTREAHLWDNCRLQPGPSDKGGLPVTMWVDLQTANSPSAKPSGAGPS